MAEHMPLQNPYDDRGRGQRWQDECLIATTDGRPLPTRALRALPPWRAVLHARVADRAGVGLEHGSLDQLVAEAQTVGGEGALGEWWTRPSTSASSPVPPQSEDVITAVDRALFGTEDGGFLHDEDDSVPVGEFRRLLHEMSFTVPAGPQPAGETEYQIGDRVQWMDMSGYELGTVDALTSTGVGVQLDGGLYLHVGTDNVPTSLRKVLPPVAASDSMRSAGCETRSWDSEDPK